MPDTPLSNEELLAVASLWRKTDRQVVTRFTGTSMEPTIRDGASVTLDCGGDVAVGDIVAFVNGGRVIVHRIVAQHRGAFLTRGDADLLPDPVLVDRDDILGRITGVESAAGWTPPAAARHSTIAALMLAMWRAAARLGGARVPLRVVGLLRAVRRRFVKSGSPDQNSA